MDFYLELHVFGAVPVRKKDVILDKGRDLLYFHVFPWRFYFMRGHSLVELTEHDDSAANIIVYSMYTYMCNCIIWVKGAVYTVWIFI